METVIQEIANQLGMAVDQAGQFITEYLPQFAAMKAMQALVPMVFLVVSTCLLIVIAIVLIRVAVKGNEFFTEEFLFMAALISSVIAITFMLVSAVLLPALIIDFIGWANYPEAMLIDMALKAVG